MAAESRHAYVPSGRSSPVVVVKWPSDVANRNAARERGSPCLLVVAADSQPPGSWGPLEDSVREPAHPTELAIRIVNLASRFDLAFPSLDDDGLVRRGGRWIAVPMLEAKVLALLLAVLGSSCTEKTSTKQAGLRVRTQPTSSTSA